MLEIVSRTNVSKKLLGFLDSQDLPKALLMAFSLIVPIVVGYGLNHLQLGIYVALGAFLVSANDIDGSIRLKVIGLLIATALSMGVLLLSFYMPAAQWVALPMYGILIFCLSYLSVFGFRASLISFSGLFALVMSFSTLFESEYHVFFVVMMVGIGGLWYALLVLIRYFLFYKKQMEFYLSEAFELTSQLMGIRSELIDPKCDRKRLLTEMLDIQSKLTTNHEVLRELLIMNRRGFSNSSFQTIRLNVFTDLVDMLELAIANPVQYDKMDLIMRTHSRQLTDFQELLNAISRRLRFFGKNISRTLRLQDDDSIRLLMQKVSKNIASFIPKADNGVESTLMLTNYQKYLQNQSDKVAHIERSLKSGNVATKQSRKRDDSLRFLTKQDYNP
ncbi:MAG TPA: FUSC family membrane protein, partial [Saprospiraceae bacterium]|nr:FUSC family membrane protein [Saprospiraceae bacterium]